MTENLTCVCVLLKYGGEAHKSQKLHADMPLRSENIQKRRAKNMEENKTWVTTGVRSFLCQPFSVRNHLIKQINRLTILTWQRTPPPFWPSPSGLLPPWVIRLASSQNLFEPRGPSAERHSRIDGESHVGKVGHDHAHVDPALPSGLPGLAGPWS